MRNGATSHSATQFWPCFVASLMSDRPRPPEPMRPMLSFSLAPSTRWYDSALSATAEAEEARNVRRDGFMAGLPGKRIRVPAMIPRVVARCAKKVHGHFGYRSAGTCHRFWNLGFAELPRIPKRRVLAALRYPKSTVAD